MEESSLQQKYFIATELVISNWLLQPFKERDERILNIMQEQLLSELQHELLANYSFLIEAEQSLEEFTKKKCYCNSKKNFELLRCKVKEELPQDIFTHQLLLDQACWLTQLHLIIDCPPPAEWEASAEPASIFYLAVFPLSWQFLPVKEKINICLKIAAIFLPTYAHEALAYVMQALDLLHKQNAVNSSLYQKVQDVQAQLSVEVVKRIKGDYRNKLKLWLKQNLNKSNYLTEWKKYAPLFKTITKEQPQLMIELYQQFLPFQTACCDVLYKLDQANNDIAAIEKICEKEIDLRIHHFARYGCYALAKDWCEKLERWCNDHVEITNIKALRNKYSKQRREYQAQENNIHSLDNIRPEIFPFYVELQKCYEVFSKEKSRKADTVKLHTLFSLQVITLLKMVAEHITKILGAPPCAFALLGLGSVSRHDMGLNSDIDAALLIAEHCCKTHPYFTAWLRLWIFYLKNSVNAHSGWVAAGLQDSNDFQNLAELEYEPYVQTPENLAYWTVTTTPRNSKRPVRALYRPSEIYTSQPSANLFTLYLKHFYGLLGMAPTALQKNYQHLAEQAFLEHEKEYFDAQEKFSTLLANFGNLSSLHAPIKEAFFKPFVNVCLNWGLYYGIGESHAPALIKHLPDLFDAFEKQNIFVSSFIEKLRRQWQQLLIIKNIERNDKEYIDKLLIKLKKINVTVLCPLWTTWKIALNSDKSVPFNPDKIAAQKNSLSSTISFIDIAINNTPLAANRVGHNGIVWSLGFHPHQPLLASAGTDKMIYLWEVPDGRIIAQLVGHTASIKKIAFNFDGKYLASGDKEGNIFVWDIIQQKIFYQFSKQQTKPLFTALAFHPYCSLWLAMGDENGQVFFWKGVGEKPYKFRHIHTDRIRTMTFNPQGTLLATGSRDHRICVWNMATQQCLATLTGHTKEIRDIQFNTLGNFLVTGSYDGQVVVWENKKDKQKWAFYKATQMHCRILQTIFDKEKIIIAGQSRKLFFWHYEKKITEEITQAHKGNIASLTYDRKNKYLASGSADYTIGLWQQKKGQFLLTAILGQTNNNALKNISNKKNSATDLFTFRKN